MGLFGPYRAILGVEVGPENFFGLYVYRLTTFVFKVLLYSCSFIQFEFVVGGGIGVVVEVSVGL